MIEIGLIPIKYPQLIVLYLLIQNKCCREKHFVQNKNYFLRTKDGEFARFRRCNFKCHITS